MNFKIVALIPARSKSKGIIDKNIKLYNGLPLIAHSINLGLECSYINDIYVSTDSVEYQNMALEYGAKVTPLRPSEISNDLSPDIDVFKFFIKMFIDKKEPIPDIIVHIRPTYPNRKVEILNDCIEKFIENYENYDSLRTVIPIEKVPYKMYHVKNNILIPCIQNFKDYIEPYNQARQIFPETFLHNGYIDIIKTKVLCDDNLLSGNRIYPYLMDKDEKNDIDNLSDFIISENKKYLY